MTCGSPAPLLNADHVISGEFYTNTTSYTCKQGFKFTSGDPFTDRTVSCTAAATWQDVNNNCEGLQTSTFYAWNIF